MCVRIAQWALLLPALVFLQSCSPGGNASVAYAIGGACSGCAAARIDTALAAIPGVVSARYNPGTQQLAIRYDSTLTSGATFIAVLNDMGYDVDDHFSIAPGIVDPCCLDGAFELSTDPACADCNASNGIDSLSLGEALDDSLLSAEMEHVLEDVILGDDALNLDVELGLDDDFADALTEELEAEGLPAGGGSP